MNYRILASFIFAGSSLGLGIMVFQKVPVLSRLPEISSREEKGWWQGVKKFFYKINPFKHLSWGKILQKILTKVRILSLKTDNKTFDWLKRLREDSQKKKISEDGNYWDKVKAFSSPSNEEDDTSSLESSKTKK